MRKISLFIAMSLDGYIADAHGGVDWLTGDDSQSNPPDVYSEFIKDVDTILMGWNTYHQVATELSPDQWVYRDFQTYVVTHQDKESTDKITFTEQNPLDLARTLKKEPGKDIWICGGANLIQQFIEQDLIDQYYISVIPTLLGSGISLFASMEKERRLKLLHTQTYNGITDLIYSRRSIDQKAKDITKGKGF